MPKPKEPQKPRSYFSVHPWAVRNCGDHSRLLAYVEISGKQETVLTVHRTSGAGHEELANHIADLINDNQNNRPLFNIATEALELCLEHDRLNFSSEQAADAALKRIKKRNW